MTYAKWIMKFRWFIVVLWIIGTVAAMVWLPQLNQVVARQSTTFLPDSSSVMQAQKLVEQIDPTHQSKSSAVVAVHDKNGLSEGDKRYFHTVMRQLSDQKSHFGVSAVQYTGNTDASVASAFISQDKTTEIGLVGFQGEITDPSTTQALTEVRSVFVHPPQGAQVYFTGDVPIQQDDIAISQKGTEKTAIVTVILVLSILLLVFRSAVAPFITLLAIGVSFLISSGVVAWLAERGLPVSTFTQTFLVAILFGAGTDYSIIMLNRYREELTKASGDRVQALSAALHAVTKTVVYSGLTVLVSFAVLYFANFGLYRSAVGVAVGIAITLATCLIFLPAVMSLLGGNLYWPRKPVAGAFHRTSRVWTYTGTLSSRRPWWTLLVLIAVLLPIALLFTNERTFDPMLDIPQSSAVEGFHTVAAAFGQGHVMPTTVVLQTNGNLKSSQGLTTIENVSKAMSSLPFVQQVDSATRPVGHVITAFQLANQNTRAANGLNQVSGGLTKLGTSLSQSGSSMSGAPQGVRKLSDGSRSITSGLHQLSGGLSSLSANTGKLSAGSHQLQSGTAELASSLGKLAKGTTSVQNGAHVLSGGLSQSATAATALAKGTQNLSDSQRKLSELASNLTGAIAAWAQSHQGDEADPQWQQIVALAQAEASGLKQSASGAKQVAGGAVSLAKGLPELTQGATSLDRATGQIATGLNQSATGARQLSQGAAQLSSGTGQLAAGATQLATGSQRLAEGSQQLTNGLQTFANSMKNLAPGLSAAGAGVHQMNDGVQQVQKALRASTQAQTSGNPGFYIPDSVVTSNKGLGQAMDAYISPDGHIAKFTVILNANPYATGAIAEIPQVEQTARAALVASPIQSGSILSGGTTATQAELNRISNQDFIRTMTMILIAIFILLVAMLRSILAPLYIIVSLSATYFVTMGILQQIATHVLRQPGVSWAVPFFVFLLLVALGVDYSIFLMSRFDEEHRAGLSPMAAIRKAMGHMGNVILSAALIMGGTFGSMIATGMTTMVEIGLSVIIGLGLYTVVLLAFFIPTCVTIVGNAHLWPFRRAEDEDFAARKAHYNRADGVEV